MKPTRIFSLLVVVVAVCSVRSHAREKGEVDWEAERAKHWAWRELADPEPPVVKRAGRVRNPVDRFLFAKLEKAGLAPNPEADERVLARRLRFDLTGLPNVGEPDEGKAFGALVDELLASPHYGERWARHWLDVARFAESHGFEQDYDRPHAYHFRDFVIQALNQDMPYDQFARWQVAGDEIAPDDHLAMMATGFLGAGVFPTQLTEKEFESARYDELDDMLNTSGMAFLGLTIGCARCHDHKFDPIATKDYYRLVSTFGLTKRSEIDVPVHDPAQEKAFAEWEKKRDALLAARETYEREQLPERFEDWFLDPPPPPTSLATWITLENAEPKSLDGALFKPLGDGSFLLAGANPRDDRWVVTAEVFLPEVTALRIEALAHDSFNRRGPGRAGNGNFALSDLRVFAKKPGEAGKGRPVKLVNPRADYQQNAGHLSVASSIDGDKRKSGWAVDGQIGKDHLAVFEFAEPVKFPGGCVLTLELDYFANVAHVIGRPRFSVSSQLAPPLKGAGRNLSLAALHEAAGKPGGLEALDEQGRASLLHAFRPLDPGWKRLQAAALAHDSVKPRPNKTMKVMVSTEGRKPMKHHADGRGYPHFYKDVHFLERGDPNQKGEVVTQAFLPLFLRGGKESSHWTVSSPPAASASATHRRHAFAKWLTDVEFGAGHVAARVIVNRLWQHHFGRGLVSTPNDFGYQSSPPSHPELLDWLASRLIENGWRLKPLHKLILTSSAWRQSSVYDPAKAAKDLDNRLLWRFTPRRLEGEVIRDSLLAVSGQLDKTMYGKGTLNESSRRRSVYFFIKRSKLIPTMQLFDAPEPLVSQGRRQSTTIAPQALLFMNSPRVREYASAFAQRLLKEAGDNREQAALAGYQAALGRRPDAGETAAALAFLESQETSYQQAKQSNPRQLALTDFAQTLFGLNEFSYLR